MANEGGMDYTATLTLRTDDETAQGFADAAKRADDFRRAMKDSAN